jgi:hypothetical protein
MSDTRRDDTDPRDEPDAGVARTGSSGTVGDTRQAENAESVLDPDGDRPEQDAAAQAERIEEHNRPSAEP